MAQELMLRTDAEPTFWNKEAAIGLPIAFPLGGIIGGIIGKNRMENEKKVGKLTSSEPSFWNKDTLLGVMLGGLVGAITVAAVVVVAGMAPALVAAGTAKAVLGMGSLAGMVGGGAIGGYVGVKRQQREFEEAKQQNIAAHVGRTTGSPELAQAVEYAMANNKEWGKSVLEQKLLSVGQQPER